MGASGSGKTTLLHCAAGLDRPTSGRVILAGQDLGPLREAQVTRLRRDRAGFAFQSFNLVPSLTVELNVALPARLVPDGRGERQVAGRGGEAAGLRPARDHLEQVGRTGMERVGDPDLPAGAVQRGERVELAGHPQDSCSRRPPG